MDETNQPEQQRPTKLTPVMDVQPPKQPVTQAETSDVDHDNPPSQPVAPIKSPPPSNEEPRSEVIDPKATQQQDQKSHPTTIKNKSPKLAIFAVIVIAILLSLGAIALYLSTNDDSDNSASKEPAPIAQTDTTSELDNTVTAIDDNLTSLEQAEEFSENDLSDETLGL